MGRAYKLLVEAAKARAKVVDYVKENKESLQEKVRGRMATQILIETEKLVKQDIKRGKIKDVELYVQNSLKSVTPGCRAGNMVKNAGVTLQEVESVIRQTLKENYAGKV